MSDRTTPPTPSRRDFVGSAVALGLAAVTGGCATQPADSGGELRVYGNLSTLELAPVLLACKGIYAGRTVLQQGGILSLYAKDGDLPNLRAQGRSHLATNSETQGLRYSVENPSLRIIFTVAEGVYRIVARRSAGIQTLADLKGKRIGTMPKTSSAFYLAQMLRSVGVAEKDVTIVPFVAGTQVPLSRMPQALLDKQIDAVTIWEPEMQKAKDILGTDAVEFFDAASYREQFSLYSTAENLADRALRPKIVAFVKALMVASEQIRRDPRETWPLVAQAARIDLRAVERSWPHHTYPGTLLLHGLLGMLAEEEVWVAQETGRTPRGRDALKTLIDTSVLEEALRL
jgi:NitT/TauT family transport system substrate-binding protein